MDARLIRSLLEEKVTPGQYLAAKINAWAEKNGINGALERANALAGKIVDGLGEDDPRLADAGELDAILDTYLGREGAESMAEFLKTGNLGDYLKRELTVEL